MLTVGVPVELPKTTANALPTEREEPLTITLTLSGQIFIQKSETPPDQLLNKLRAISQERSGDRIFLRADGTIPYETVVQVMGMLNAGGFTNIALVTDVGGPGRAFGWVNRRDAFWTLYLRIGACGDIVLALSWKLVRSA